MNFLLFKLGNKELIKVEYFEIIFSFLFEFSDIRRCGEEYDKEWKS